MMFKIVLLREMKTRYTKKISDCIRKGFNKDEARHTVIQIIKNLPNHLLSIKGNAARGCGFRL